MDSSLVQHGRSQTTETTGPLIVVSQATAETQETDLTHLEKEQLLLRAPEERMFEHAGGGGARLGLGVDHLLDQILRYDVI